MNKFWSFKPVAASPHAEDPDSTQTADAGEVELLVYGCIGDGQSWWDDVTAAEFARELGQYKNRQVHCRINSGGGDVFGGIAIYNLLANHPGGCRTTCDGLAASAASLIFMAGKARTMGVGSMLMVHNPSSLAWGESAELRKTADVLDQLRDSLVSIYQQKTTLSADKVKALMDAETWMSAQDAVAQGFATESAVGEPVKVENRGGYVFFNGIGFPVARAPRVPAAVAVALSPAASGSAPAAVPAQPPITRATLEARAPELLAALLAEGRTAGVTAERERIKTVRALALPGHQALLQRAMFDEPLSPEAFAVAQTQEEQTQKTTYLANAATDATAAVVPAAAAPARGASDDATLAHLIQIAAEAGSVGRK